MVLTDIELTVIITLSFTFGLMTEPLVRAGVRKVMKLIEKL